MSLWRIKYRWWKSWGRSLDSCSAAVRSQNIDLDDLILHDLLVKLYHSNIHVFQWTPVCCYTTRRRTGVKAVKQPWLVVCSCWPGVHLTSKRCPADQLPARRSKTLSHQGKKKKLAKPNEKKREREKKNTMLCWTDTFWLWGTLKLSGVA